MCLLMQNWIDIMQRYHLSNFRMVCLSMDLHDCCCAILDRIFSYFDHNSLHRDGRRDLKIMCLLLFMCSSKIIWKYLLRSRMWVPMVILQNNALYRFLTQMKVISMLNNIILFQNIQEQVIFLFKNHYIIILIKCTDNHYL